MTKNCIALRQAFANCEEIPESNHELYAARQEYLFDQARLLFLDAQNRKDEEDAVMAAALYLQSGLIWIDGVELEPICCDAAAVLAQSKLATLEVS